MIKIKNLCILILEYKYFIWMAMSQNLPVGGFMLAENTSQFSKDLKKIQGR